MTTSSTQGFSKFTIVSFPSSDVHLEMYLGQVTMSGGNAAAAVQVQHSPHRVKLRTDVVNQVLEIVTVYA
jgi:hypothetical protein